MPKNVGAYSIEAEIGRGGMGVVYRARDTRLDRAVALKALPAELMANPDRVERLDREAKALAKLDHPHVGRIYGVEEHDGARYLVLELVEGETLAERLSRGPLSAADATDYALQIASGIEAAHDAGVIHRDLKPQNIMLTPEGNAKVLDFGLARAEPASHTSFGPDSPTLTSPAQQHSPTIPGAILGTAAYMSPEQARGRWTDQRTDIWSFGVMLYEMLMGASPFAGETVSDSIGAVLHKELEFGALPDDVPEGLRRVLRRCLARDKADRYRNMGDVWLDLRDPALPTRVDASVAPAARRLTFSPALGLLAIAVVAILVAVLPLRSTPSVPYQHTSIEAPAGMTISSFRLTPSGDAIVMVCFDREATMMRESFRLYVRRLDERDAVAVPNSEDVNEFDISPDGKWLAFLAPSDDPSQAPALHKAPMDLSSPPTELLRVPRALLSATASRGTFCFGPAGEIVMLEHRETGLILHIFDASTGRAIRTLDVIGEEDSFEFASLQSAFGSDHVRIVDPSYKDGGFRIDTSVVDLRSGEASVLIADARVATLLGDDRLIFCRDDQLFATGFDAANMQTTGENRVVEDEIRASSAWENGEFDLSSDGTLAYLRGGVIGGSRRLVVIDQQTGEATDWSEERRRYTDQIAVTRDGSRVAALVAGPASLLELWIGDTSDGRLRRLVAIPGGDVYFPVFTPDGESVIVSIWRPEHEKPGTIMMYAADGSTPPRELYSGWTPETFTLAHDVTDDGTRVLLTRFAEGRTLVFEIDLTDQDATPRPLFEAERILRTNYAIVDGVRDGSAVSYSARETGSLELHIRRLFDESVGPAIPVTTHGASFGAWIDHPELGAGMWYLDANFREWIVPISFGDGRVRIGERVRATPIFSFDFAAAAMSADGTLFALLRGEDEAPATRIEIVRGWAQSLDR